MAHLSFRYKGGPTIQRKLICQGFQRESYCVEVYPLCLKLTDSRDGSSAPIRLSKQVWVSMLPSLPKLSSVCRMLKTLCGGFIRLLLVNCMRWFVLQEVYQKTRLSALLSLFLWEMMIHSTVLFREVMVAPCFIIWISRLASGTTSRRRKAYSWILHLKEPWRNRAFK